MGGISSMLGLAGGINGTGVSGPQSATIVQPFNAQSATDATTQSQNAIQQQQAFLQAVQAQNGLQNQSNVYNQLQGVANGTGPNPAQAQLNQATSANTANQAALMAGQRGSGANAGLIARQAAMQGASNQQQAAGQAATMQANQSLNALNSLGGLANTQAQQQAAATGALTGATQGEQGQILGAIQGQNSANVQNQAGINAANAGIATTSMGQQGNMIGNLAGGIGAALHLADGGKIPRQMYAEAGSVYQDIPAGSDPFSTSTAAPMAPAVPVAPAAQPQAQSGPKSKVGQHMTGTAPSPLQGAALTGNTIGKGIGTGLNALFGSAKSNNQATQSALPDPDSAERNAYGANSSPAQAQAAMQQLNFQDQMSGNQGPMLQQQTTQDIGDGGSMAAKGGKVPAMVSPGEKYLDPQEAQAAKQGANPMKMGETIPGKPKVDGAKNDYANDIVPKTLEEGGLVLPRSVTQSKNPEWAAHQFVRDHMAKGGLVGMKAPKKSKGKK